MRKNYNRLLKNLSVDNVQIDKFDHEPARNETKEIETVSLEKDRIVAATKESPTTPKRTRKKKIEKAVSGRRFRGKDYTTTRTRKDLMALLKLLFEERTGVEIIEQLMIAYLEKNKKKLAEKLTDIHLK